MENVKLIVKTVHSVDHYNKINDAITQAKELSKELDGYLSDPIEEGNMIKETYRIIISGNERRVIEIVQSLNEIESTLRYLRGWGTSPRIEVK